jgi:hypothetical protein
MRQVMNVIEKLQNWYSSQCNGEWEHEFGVLIENLDNPGWMVTINLTETDLEDVPFEDILDERTETDWIDCKKIDRKFRGMGGAHNLIELISIFISWSERADR